MWRKHLSRVTLTAVVAMCLPFAAQAATAPSELVFQAPSGDASGTVFALGELRFMARGWQEVGTIKLHGKGAASTLSGGWTNAGRGMMGLRAGAKGLIRCTIPADADAVVFKYRGSPRLRQPTAVSLNRTMLALPPVTAAYECCLLFDPQHRNKRFAKHAPILNLWSERNIAPGPNVDGEVHIQVDYTNGNDPISCGEYRVRVEVHRDPDNEDWPNAPAAAKLYGLDLTSFDGFIVSVTAPYKTYASASLIDSNNYNWSGGGQPVEPGRWTRFAVPFEECHNGATAGDGVLKLAQLRLLDVNAGNKDLTRLFWVGTPQFFRGAPPRGIKVVQRSFNDKAQPLPSSPTRRHAAFLDGVSVEDMDFDGRHVWVATDAGLVKLNRTDPSVVVGRWSLEEGMIDDDLHAVVADNGKVWTASTNGVSLFDKGTFKNLTSESGLLPGAAMALTKTQDAIWVGQTRGIARIDRKTHEVRSFRRRGGWAPESTGGQGVPIEDGRGVYADLIVPDDIDGSIWHGAAGIGHTDRTGRQLGGDHEHGTASRAIGIYPVGEELWYFHRGGVCRQLKSGEELSNTSLRDRRYAPAGNHSAVITSTFADPKAGVVWVAYNDGVGYYDPKQDYFAWAPGASVALGSLVPQKIKADDTHVWVGTDNGLMVFGKDQFRQPWRMLDMECPVDVWATGVRLGSSAVGCDSCTQFTSIDTTRGANRSGSSLLLEYLLGAERNSRTSLCLPLRIDATGTAGISFWAMSDRVRAFAVDVKRVASLDRKDKNAASQTWRSVIRVGPKWQQYVLPYAKMQPVLQVRGRGKANLQPIPGNSIQIASINIHRGVEDFNACNDAGRLWIDQIAWVYPSNSPGKQYTFLRR